MVESMDKQKALDILGLALSSTRTDARTTFRKLAKTWHPDRFAKDPLKAKAAEEKMKQVNEAFHFLLPLLPDIDVEQDAGQKPSDFSSDCVQRYGGFKHLQHFFSALAAGLKKCVGRRRRANDQAADRFGQVHKPGVKYRTGTLGRARKSTFEAIFEGAVNHNPADNPPRFHSKTGHPGCYADYGRYVDPAVGHSVTLWRAKNKGVGPVEEISPILPVKRYR